jgi:hypothetical protein
MRLWLSRIAGISVVATIVWYGTRLWFHRSPLRVPFTVVALVGIVAGLCWYWRAKQREIGRRSRERENGFWRMTVPRGGPPPGVDAT